MNMNTKQELAKNLISIAKLLDLDMELIESKPKKVDKLWREAVFEVSFMGIIKTLTYLIPLSREEEILKTLTLDLYSARLDEEEFHEIARINEIFYLGSVSDEDTEE